MDSRQIAVPEDSMDLATIKKLLKKEQRDIKLKKFLHNRLAMTGFVIMILVMILALFAPVLAPMGPYDVDVKNRLSAPSLTHLFGTDNYGRDLFARVLYGARISLGVGAGASLIAAIVGVIVGLYAAYYKWMDNLLMRICDGLKAIPSTLLAIALMAVLGSSMTNVIISLAIVHIPDIARVVRAEAILIKEQTYVEAMKSLGASSKRIIWSHIAPNVISPVIVQISFIFATAIISEAALSFLGVGIPVPTPSWGNILSDGKTYIYNSWWMVVFPGISMALTVLGLNLFGDGIRDVLDPMTN